LSNPVTDRFHRHYYDSRVWQNQTRWLGVPAQKCPLDLWIYQELLHELRPDLIVETGTSKGGSALYLAAICDLLDQGQVITIDVRPVRQPEHPRITYITGSSTDPPTLTQVREAAHSAFQVMVLLDSDHHADHVLAELRAYAPLVTPGSYLIVEDTNINGHPVRAQDIDGPGPAEAVAESWPSVTTSKST
jgi:cephalosporin hydroxylase